jgi:hypothetical protein
VILGRYFTRTGSSSASQSGWNARIVSSVCRNDCGRANQGFATGKKGSGRTGRRPRDSAGERSAQRPGRPPVGLSVSRFWFGCDGQRPQPVGIASLAAKAAIMDAWRSRVGEFQLRIFQETTEPSPKRQRVIAGLRERSWAVYCHVLPGLSP